METSTSKQVIIVAGEASGDMHAAQLVRDIKTIDPSIRFSGVGGTLMKDAGVDLYYDMTRLSVVGFVEVLKHYGELKKVFDLVISRAVSTKADAIILVDYPGFNLRLAKKLRQLRKNKIKIIYYISPQVWAWHADRISLIKKVVDRMIVFFPFEQELYAKHKMATAFVGHPLLDQIQVTQPAESFLKSHGLTPGVHTIALLPGSRAKEVEEHLPIMLETAKLLQKEFHRIQFILLRSSSVDVMTFERQLRKFPGLPIKTIAQKTYNGINAADFCLVASGTATLEVGILEKPMVIIYKTSALTYFLASWLIRIPYIGLVNVVAGKKIVPEYIQKNAKPQKIAAEVTKILKDRAWVAEIKRELRRVKELLGAAGASERAAQEVIKVLG